MPRSMHATRRASNWRHRPHPGLRPGPEQEAEEGALTYGGGFPMAKTLNSDSCALRSAVRRAGGRRVHRRRRPRPITMHPGQIRDADDEMTISRRPSSWRSQPFPCCSSLGYLLCAVLKRLHPPASVGEHPDWRERWCATGALPCSRSIQPHSLRHSRLSSSGLRTGPFLTSRRPASYPRSSRWAPHLRPGDGLALGEKGRLLRCLDGLPSWSVCWDFVRSGDGSSLCFSRACGSCVISVTLFARSDRLIVPTNTD